MPSAQTSRCRRCGGDLGAGSQQGVCLECIKKLQAAKRARDSGRRRVAAAAKPESSRRESVRTMTCVDCGQRFFEVDIAAKRIVMVDGQPVCAACLKKRGGLGLVPVFAGSGLVALALLYLYPAHVLMALIVFSVLAIITGAYYGGWERKTRLMIVGIGLMTFIVCFYVHGFVRVAQDRSRDDAAMKPYYPPIEIAIKEKDRKRIESLITRARKVAGILKLDVSRKKHGGLIDKLEAKARQEMTPPGMDDPYDAGLYIALAKKLSGKKRWGKDALKGIAHEELEGEVKRKHITVELYVSEKYDPEDTRERSNLEKEITTIFTDLMQRDHVINKVTVTAYAAEDGEPEELESKILVRQGYKDWLTFQRASRDAAMKNDYDILEFCGDPPPKFQGQ